MDAQPTNAEQKILEQLTSNPNYNQSFYPEIRNQLLGTGELKLNGSSPGQKAAAAEAAKSQKIVDAMRTPKPKAR